MENEKMLITIERYDQLIGERAVYKSKAQRLEDENIELKGRIKDLENEKTEKGDSMIGTVNRKIRAGGFLND
ncbi:hypothetical protein [Staphylococcus delphini]|uniref:hypothetical protein n=1 Tax=Staphylococcus delphini TaxID=53344 RepID=UPI001CCC522A|nr:hypothetical protein [Staphylococcus delphini]MBZ8174788.1 hypothetical protein [Staphylococcus delphini]